MHPVVNHLIQLQELTLIRDEQKVAGGTGHLEKLDESIKTMSRELQPDVRVICEKLHERDHVFIGPVSDGVCSMCGMKLPISQVQAVRLGNEIQRCPNCARILYYLESAARRLGKSARRSAPRKAGIARFSSETLMIPRLASNDRDNVVQELASKMEHEGFIDNAEKLADAALNREAIVSTAVDKGLAFPHVRGVEGGGLAFALGLSPKGVTFDGPGRGLTRIVFLIVIPTSASAFYLKLLAGLTETFMKTEARKVILAEKESGKLWKLLVRVTRSTIK